MGFGPSESPSSPYITCLASFLSPNSPTGSTDEAKKLAYEQMLLDRAEFHRTTKELFSAGGITKVTFDGLAKDYERFYSETLTLPRAVANFGLLACDRENIVLQASVEKAERAAARLADKAQREVAKTQREAHYAWSRTLIFSPDVPKHLGISGTEYKRWMDEGKLVPSMMREFRKWGKSLETPLFDPVYLATITPELIAQWRVQHKDLTTNNRKVAAVKSVVKSKRTRAIKRDIALDDYANEFAIARTLSRQFQLCFGPTNSGKTHHAIEALIKANSGVYLAPLRLLALENYERLKAAGVAVSLLTGEERIIDPKATHVCSTIEMCNFSTAVDVAVIDEVQLIGDSQRGWAWVAAILGVPAETVYACGAVYAAPAVKALLEQAREVFEETLFERLTVLSIEDGPVHLNSIQKGDAVIAFSRQDVLNFAALLKSRDLKVSVIYGALSPEVRRLQAKAFIDGQTDVVVATDAIGMGLNLPIRRIVFSTSRKYDGTNSRRLTPAEVQQIAGRAGRFGLHEQGFVSAFAVDDLTYIRSIIDHDVNDLSSPFFVMPTWLHISTILAHLGTDNVRQAVALFQRVKFSGVFQQADLTDTLAKLRAIEYFMLPAKDLFALATAPADPGNEEDMSWLRSFAKILITPDMYLAVPGCALNLGVVPNSKHLPVAEAYSRVLALFSWFACKFPKSASTEGLAEQRQDLAEFIDKCLTEHRKVFVAKRRKQYQWREEEFDEDFLD